MFVYIYLVYSLSVAFCGRRAVSLEFLHFLLRQIGCQKHDSKKMKKVSSHSSVINVNSAFSCWLVEVDVGIFFLRLDHQKHCRVREKGELDSLSQGKKTYTLSGANDIYLYKRILMSIQVCVSVALHRELWKEKFGSINQ